MSGSLASCPDSIPLFFFSGSSALCPDSIPFYVWFSDIVPNSIPSFLFRVLRHRAWIRSILFFFWFSGIVIGFDFFFNFEFSSIVLEFDPFFLLRVFRHHAWISLSFPTSCPDFPHLPRHHDRVSLIFSDITSGFLLSFSASCPDHSSSQALCSSFSYSFSRGDSVLLSLRY